MSQPGMFLDGITYAVVARNLAAGQGTFWSPFYTTTVYPAFHEQPPLGFALEAVAFAIGGDHLAIERVYSLSMGLCTLVLMVLLWRTAFADRDHDWLPILFWLLPSTVTWALINNMLENTQVVLTTAAMLACVRSLRSPSRGMTWAVVAGILVVGAVLVKGPNGLFPLAAPALAFLILPDMSGSRAQQSGLTMVATTAAFALGLFGWPEARSALTDYWRQHLAAAISGERGIGRFNALRSLIRHLASGVFLRMAALLALFWIVARLLPVNPSRPLPPGKRWAWFFLAMGIAASVPVLVSTKIAGHYLVPSIPLFALGFAGLARPWVASLQLRYGARPLAAKALLAAGIILILTALTLPFLPVSIEPRDVRWMAEYRIVGPYLGRGTTIGTCAGAAGDWGLQAYMQRLFMVSLDAGADNHAQYLQLRDRECEAPAQCAAVASSERLTLWNCTDR
jgi:hypothetical protein